MTSSTLHRLLPGSTARHASPSLLEPSTIVLLVMLALHGWWEYHLWYRTQEIQVLVKMLNEERADHHIRLKMLEVTQRP